MTLADFIDSFGASLDKGKSGNAKDFPVFIQVEENGQTTTLQPTNVTFNYGDKDVTIEAE